MGKGINEIVGVILMIGVVVLVIGIITGWNLEFVETETGSQECLAETNFIIESTQFNLSGNDEYQIKVTNFGSLPLYGFGVLMNTDTGTINFDASNVSQGGVSKSSPLKRGQSVYLLAYMGNKTGMVGSIREVVITNKACPMVSTRASISATQS